MAKKLIIKKKKKHKNSTLNPIEFRQKCGFASYLTKALSLQFLFTCLISSNLNGKKINNKKQTKTKNITLNPMEFRQKCGFASYLTVAVT